MSSAAAPVACDLAPEERRRQVAAILAQGVVRHRRIAELAKFDELSRPRDTCLEVVSETRLSVSVGFADESASPESEENHGRNP